MDWSSPTKVPAFQEAVTTDIGKHWFAVEAPAHYESHIGWAPTITRDRKHPLLRPYERLLEFYKEDVGSVHFYFLKLPGRIHPHVLFSLAISDHHSHLRNPNLLPGSLYFFPGLTSRTLRTRSGKEIEVHHISVKEGENNRIIAYTRGENGEEHPSGRSVQETSPRELPGDLPPIHLMTTRVGSEEDLERAGFAFTPIDEKLMEIREEKKAFLPDPTIRSHWLDNAVIPPQLQGEPYHLWSIVLLVSQIPEKRDLNILIRTLLDANRVSEDPGVAQLGEHEDPERLRVAIADLSPFGINAAYDKILHIRGIMKGRLQQGPVMGAWTSPLPVDLENYADISPEEFRRLIERT